jgi:hypothetical protein
MKKIDLQSHMRELFREQGLLEDLPTYEEYTEDMPLIDQLTMYYEVDIENYIGNPWDIIKDMTEDYSKWLEEFNKQFKEYLQEREYIQ